MKKLIFFIIFFLVFFTSFINAECSSGQIDINSASLEDLDLLTGVGPAIAQNIVDARPFSSIEDLINVNRIGEVTLEKIKTQNLACVSTEAKSEKEDNNISLEINLTKKEYLENQDNYKNIITSEVIEPSETIINLNSEELLLEDNSVKDQSLVYESKNQKVKKYLLWAFCIFLISIIALLLIKD